MIEYLWIAMAAGFGLATIAYSLDKIRAVMERSLTCDQRSLATLEKRLSIEHEQLEANKKLIDQGEETIALLKAINDNLEHRSIKN